MEKFIIIQKKFYDITQTNAPKESMIKEYNTRKLLEATLKDCEVPRVSVDKLPNGTLGSEFSKDEKCFVCLQRNEQRTTISKHCFKK